MATGRTQRKETSKVVDAFLENFWPPGRNFVVVNWQEMGEEIDKNAIDPLLDARFTSPSKIGPGAREPSRKLCISAIARLSEH